MILSVSRRTDIPAFYSKWFLNRIEAGFALVRNPMNFKQVSKININPGIVDCIVFWTKNPQKLVDKLDRLNQFKYYFQYTITGYGEHIEPNVPSLDDSIACFLKLSNAIGSKKVIWRYDPIAITTEMDIEYHKKHFEYIAQKLSGYTEKCVISFVDTHGKGLIRMPQFNFQPSDEQMDTLLSHMLEMSKKHNFELASCAEKIDPKKYGIAHNKCIDDKLIEEIVGVPFIMGKDKTQRELCGCVSSVDIGTYNTCVHGCLYCYANSDPNAAWRNFTRHNSNSELMFGELTPQDKVKERKINNRVMLFPSN